MEGNREPERQRLDQSHTASGCSRILEQTAWRISLASTVLGSWGGISGVLSMSSLSPSWLLGHPGPHGLLLRRQFPQKADWVEVTSVALVPSCGVRVHYS